MTEIQNGQQTTQVPEKASALHGMHDKRILPESIACDLAH